MAEAPELGVPLPDLARPKTAAREARDELAPTLDRIADLVMVGQPVVEAAHGA
jgi:chromosome partitioning protein